MALALTPSPPTTMRDARRVGFAGQRRDRLREGLGRPHAVVGDLGDRRRCAVVSANCGRSGPRLRRGLGRSPVAGNDDLLAGAALAVDDGDGLACPAAGLAAADAGAGQGRRGGRGRRAGGGGRRPRPFWPARHRRRRRSARTTTIGSPPNGSSTTDRPQHENTRRTGRARPRSPARIVTGIGRAASSVLAERRAQIIRRHGLNPRESCARSLARRLASRRCRGTRPTRGQTQRGGP